MLENMIGPPTASARTSSASLEQSNPKPASLMISMMNGKCRLFPTTWEWSDEIDLERAHIARAKAEERLKDATISNEARVRAEAKLYRAMIRIGTVSGK